LGFMNLITSTVVDIASAARDENHEHVAVENQRFALRKMAKWKSLYSSVDTNGDGYISMGELLEGFENEKDLREYMQCLDIDREDLALIFDLMDVNHSGSLSYDEFVNHFVKAQSQDPRMYMMVMKLQSAQIMRALDAQNMCLHDIQTSLDKKTFSNHFEKKQVQQRLKSTPGPDKVSDKVSLPRSSSDTDPNAVATASFRADVKQKDQECIVGQDVSTKLTDLMLKVKTSTEAIDALTAQTQKLQHQMSQSVADSANQLQEHKEKSTEVHATTQKLLQATFDMIHVAKTETPTERRLPQSSSEQQLDISTPLNQSTPSILQRSMPLIPLCCGAQDVGLDEAALETLVDRHLGIAATHSSASISAPCTLEAQTPPLMPPRIPTKCPSGLGRGPEQAQRDSCQPQGQTTPNTCIWNAKPRCLSPARSAWRRPVARGNESDFNARLQHQAGRNAGDSMGEDSALPSYL